METNKGEASPEVTQANPAQLALSQTQSNLVMKELVRASFLNLLLSQKSADCWLFRDDIGSPYGIKGCEEQVNSVGMHHGYYTFPHDHWFKTYNSATLRRGFKVFARSCQGCHGAIHTKYDLLVDKAFQQRELMNKMVYLPRVHPAHQKHKGDYFQEWDFRQRVIHDRIWAPYFTVHQAKNANGGLWPKDLSKVASHNPCMPGYVYNVLTGYHYQPPFGIDIPEGKYFNPYFDHMIVGMPQQLYDGMMEYEDGTPSSAPQMAHDVSEYLAFITNSKKGDQKVYITLALAMLATFYPVIYFYSKYHLINTQCYRYELYAIKGGGYRKFRDKMFRTHRTPGNWQGWFS